MNMSDLTKILAEILLEAKPDMEEIKFILNRDEKYRKITNYNNAVLDFTSYQYKQNKLQTIFELAAKNGMEVFKTLFDYVFNSEDIQTEIKHQVFFQAFKAALDSDTPAIFNLLLQQETYLNHCTSSRLSKNIQIATTDNKSELSIGFSGDVSLLNQSLVQALTFNPPKAEEYIRQLLLLGANYQMPVEAYKTLKQKTPTTAPKTCVSLSKAVAKLDLSREIQILFELAVKWGQILSFYKNPLYSLSLQHLDEMLKLGDPKFILENLDKLIQKAVAQSHVKHAEVIQESSTTVTEDYRFVLKLFKDLAIVCQHHELHNFYKELKKIGLHLLNCEVGQDKLFKSTQDRDDFFYKPLIQPLFSKTELMPVINDQLNTADKEPNSPRLVSVSKHRNTQFTQGSPSSTSHSATTPLATQPANPDSILPGSEEEQPEKQIQNVM